MLRRDSKYYLNCLINPVGNVKEAEKSNQQPRGYTKEGPTERQACADGRSTELRSKWAPSQPKDSDPHLQDGESEGNGILELRKTQVTSLGFTSDSGTLLSPAHPNTHWASAGQVQQAPTPPPLKSVHCITRQPGWKVLPDFCPNLPPAPGSSVPQNHT